MTAAFPFGRVRFSMTLAGAYVAETAQQKPLALHLEAEAPVRQLGRCRLEGTIEAAELPLSGPVRGALRLGATCRYDLEAPGGWILAAEQHVTLSGWPAGFTVIRGSLRHGDELRPVELRFDPRGDLRTILASFAFHRS